MATPDGKAAGGTEREFSDEERKTGKLSRFMGTIGNAAKGVREAFFGPGEPPAPIAQKEAHGRQFDYPFAVNTLLARPRTEQGENAVTFEMLRRLAEPALGGLDLLRLAIETRKDQMAAQKWTIKSRDPNLLDGGERARAVEKAMRRPDGLSSFTTWQRMLLEDVLVLDAAAIYLRRTKAKPSLPAPERPGQPGLPPGQPGQPGQEDPTSAAGAAGPRKPGSSAFARPPGDSGQPALPGGAEQGEHAAGDDPNADHRDSDVGGEFGGGRKPGGADARAYGEQGQDADPRQPDANPRPAQAAPGRGDNRAPPPGGTSDQRRPPQDERQPPPPPGREETAPGSGGNESQRPTPQEQQNQREENEPPGKKKPQAGARAFGRAEFAQMSIMEEIAKAAGRRLPPPRPRDSAIESSEEDRLVEAQTKEQQGQEQPAGDREAGVRDPRRGTEPAAGEAAGPVDEDPRPGGPAGDEADAGARGAQRGATLDAGQDGEDQSQDDEEQGVPGAAGEGEAAVQGEGGGEPTAPGGGQPKLGPDGNPVMERIEPWKPVTARDLGCLLEAMDAAIIKKLINVDGRTPLPPEPAYIQNVKGMPATMYTADELVYSIRNPRTNRIYGFGPVEQVMTTVNIALRRQLSQLEYYTAGSVPDMIMGVPETWNADQIAQFQAWWDSVLSGNTAERRRARFVPGGVNPVPINAERIKDEFDDWLARVICFAFSLPYQALVKDVNRATAESSKEQSDQEGMEPLKLWWKDVMDELLEKAFDAPDLEFVYSDEEISDAATKATVWKTATGGKAWAKPSEARKAYGLPPDPQIDNQPEPAPPGFGGMGMPPGMGGPPGQEGEGEDGQKPPNPFASPQGDDQGRGVPFGARKPPGQGFQPQGGTGGRNPPPGGGFPPAKKKVPPQFASKAEIDDMVRAAVVDAIQKTAPTQRQERTLTASVEFKRDESGRVVGARLVPKG